MPSRFPSKVPLSLYLNALPPVAISLLSVATSPTSLENSLPVAAIARRFLLAMTAPMPPLPANLIFFVPFLIWSYVLNAMLAYLTILSPAGPITANAAPGCA